MIAFVLIGAVIPIGTRAAPADEWIYVRSVDRLVQNGLLAVPNPAAMTLVGQTLWGAVFEALPLNDFAALRISVAVLVLVSGLALHRICRLLGASSGQAGLAVLAYLFCPLLVVLSWSFMTDATFTALLVIAAWCFAESTNTTGASGGSHLRLTWVFAGSIVAAASILVRQQGILLALAVVVFEFISNRQSIRAAAKTAIVSLGVPFIVTAAYYSWLFATTGVPDAQKTSVAILRSLSPGALLNLAFGVTFVGCMMLGFFCLPVTVATAVDTVRRGLRSTRARCISLIVTAALGSVAVIWANSGRIFPYSSSWLTVRGVGTFDDLADERPVLLGHGLLIVLTVFVVMSSALALAGTGQRVWRSPRRDARRLLVVIVCLQWLGIVVSSAPFATVPSLDRYYLPLLPVGVALAVTSVVWSKRGLIAATVIAAVIGVGGVLSTRDWLVSEGAAWRLGDRALAMGVPPLHLEVGAGWDGYHTYDIARAARLNRRQSNGPSWLFLWNLPIEPVAMVTSSPDSRGYCVAGSLRYQLVFGGMRTDYLLVRCQGSRLVAR
jgi:4-amino-4-deoxy-L-arabinose transferase-like glycosyltransferase